MPKKILLCLLALMLCAGVCFAETEKKANDDEFMKAWREKRIRMTEDKFYGITYTFVRCENKANMLDLAGYWRTTLDFTIENNSKKPLLGYYIELQYHSDDIYHLDNEMHVKLGDAVIVLPRQTESSYANQSATAQYKLTDEFFNTLKNFKGDILVRIYYRTLTGNYYRDVKVSAKKIEDIRLLFSVPRHELRVAPQ